LTDQSKTAPVIALKSVGSSSLLILPDQACTGSKPFELPETSECQVFWVEWAHGVLFQLTMPLLTGE
jgi:hypothetical protein